MKKYLVPTAFGLIALLTATSSFAKGKDVEKITTEDQGTVIRDGDETTAYNDKGKWVYTIEHFTSKNLPEDVTEVVVNNFGYYDITGMEELKQPGEDPVYIVHMQDDSTIKTVQVCGDDAEITAEYTRGN